MTAHTTHAPEIKIKSSIAPWGAYFGQRYPLLQVHMGVRVSTNQISTPHCVQATFNVPDNTAKGLLVHMMRCSHKYMLHNVRASAVNENLRLTAPLHQVLNYKQVHFKYHSLQVLSTTGNM